MVLWIFKREENEAKKKKTSNINDELSESQSKKIMRKWKKEREIKFDCGIAFWSHNVWSMYKAIKKKFIFFEHFDWIEIKIFDILLSTLSH